MPNISKKTDPKKRPSVKNDTTKTASTEVSKKNAALLDTQQLSDGLAKRVARKQITMKEAQKLQRDADKKALNVKSIREFDTKGQPTSRHGTSPASPPRPPKFRRNRRGNIEAF